MNDDKSVNDILTVFARYGFKKTSMEDIARAARISRQSIYNRFGSKEAVFEWVVVTFISNLLKGVAKTLQAPNPAPLVSLAQAYDIWAGSQIPLLSGTGHGAEILDLAIATAHRAPTDYENEFATLISVFLQESGLARDPVFAENKMFVLNLASKGLLLKSTSTEAFSQDMKRVISTILG